MKNTALVIAVFVGVLVASLFALYLTQIPGAPAERETFAQKEIGMPVVGAGGMGPYDNVSVPGASGWLMSEKAPAGASPLRGMPTLDFLNNPRVSPSCCPSAVTTDAGCVCISDSDKATMSSRGGNRS
jgi:hypothetical protein